MTWRWRCIVRWGRLHWRGAAKAILLRRSVASEAGRLLLLHGLLLHGLLLLHGSCTPEARALLRLQRRTTKARALRTLLRLSAETLLRLTAEATASSCWLRTPHGHHGHRRASRTSASALGLSQRHFAGSGDQGLTLL